VAATDRTPPLWNWIGSVAQEYRTAVIIDITINYNGRKTMKQLNRNDLMKVKGADGGQGYIGDCFTQAAFQGAEVINEPAGPSY
jgi:hypothetical protein